MELDDLPKETLKQLIYEETLRFAEENENWSKSESDANDINSALRTANIF